MKQRNYIDLFHGIGGFALGAYWAGKRFDNHFCSDIEPYAVELYKQRFPDSIQLGDITKIDWEKLKNEYEGDWYITGGFPCQPHSVAGKRLASGDERDLWSYCKTAVSILRPKYALFENVSGLLISENGKFFNGVLSDLAETGYDAEWQTISACSVGAPHTRNRVWIVTYPHKANEYSRVGNGRVFIQRPQEKSFRRDYWEEFRLVSGNVAPEKWQLKREHEPEPLLVRNDNGLPDLLDRQQGTGNAIVPQIAEMIWRLID